jgi:glycosyltransferase involved in cell wall biosynthesis
MRVLFVSSGNKKSGISPIVFAQGESLRKKGVEVEYFVIKGKGLWGYLKGIVNLILKTRKVKYDLIHAHYSLSGFVAAFTFKKRIIVSLMGTDAHRKGLQRLAIKLFNSIFWEKTIVKTQEMKTKLGIKNALIIPNGVDISIFKPGNKDDARKRLNLPTDIKILIFVSDPKRKEKNFPLAQNAVTLINNHKILLIPVFNVSHSKVVDYYNAADALLLTSLWEGSVNVVKEALACNTPVVSTNVGDVYQNIKNLNGYVVANATPEDFAVGIETVLNCKSVIKGRDRLLELGLDSDSIALKILELYNSLLN